MTKKKIETQVEETPAVTSEAITPAQPTNDMLEGFDIKSFFADQQPIPIQSEQMEIPVRQPKRQQWFRIHPTLEQDVYLLKIEEDNEFFLLQPSVIPYITTKTQRYRLYLGQIHTGGYFFFPTVLKDEMGKWNSYHRAAFNAIPKAKEKWTRLEADKQNQTYIIFQADGIAEPVWDTSLTIETTLLRAFKDKVIAQKDHPIIRQLAGKFNEKTE